jgi:hypothetical protein
MKKVKRLHRAIFMEKVEDKDNEGSIVRVWIKKEEYTPLKHFIRSDNEMLKMLLKESKVSEKVLLVQTSRPVRSR